MLLHPHRDQASDYGTLRDQVNGAGSRVINSDGHSNDLALLELTSTQGLGLPFLPAVYPPI